MSPYLSTNQGALNAATYLDNLFGNQTFSFFGLVLLGGLYSDLFDAVGGILGAIISARDLEKLSGKPAAVPHPAVLAYASSLSISDDIEAETHLRSTARDHLALPLSRSALYLSDKGTLGGTCGGENDYRVLAALSKLEKLLIAEREDSVAIVAAREELAEAVKMREETSAGKSDGGSRGGKNDSWLLVIKSASKRSFNFAYQLAPGAQDCKRRPGATLTDHGALFFTIRVISLFSPRFHLFLAPFFSLPTLSFSLPPPSLSFSLYVTSTRKPRGRRLSRPACLPVLPRCCTFPPLSPITGSWTCEMQREAGRPQTKDKGGKNRTR